MTSKNQDQTQVCDIVMNEATNNNTNNISNNNNNNTIRTCHSGAAMLTSRSITLKSLPTAGKCRKRQLGPKRRLTLPLSLHQQEQQGPFTMTTTTYQTLTNNENDNNDMLMHIDHNEKKIGTQTNYNPRRFRAIRYLQWLA